MKKINDCALINEYLERPILQQLFPDTVHEYILLFEFDSQETIIDTRFDIQQLFLLLDGRAKLYADSSNGKSLLLDFLEYPSIIGEREMRGNSPISTIRTITPCVCLGIPFDIVHSFLYDKVSFWKTMNEINGIKFQRQISHCIKTITLPLDARYAYYISKNSYNDLYREPHTEAAAYLGVSYRHLLYMTKTFIKQNILKKTASGYRIMDSEALNSIMLEEKQKK